MYSVARLRCYEARSSRNAALRIVLVTENPHNVLSLSVSGFTWLKLIHQAALPTRAGRGGGEPGEWVGCQSATLLGEYRTRDGASMQILILSISRQIYLAVV